MAANSRIRHLIAAAANSVASYEDDDDFESILNTTRRCFRPRTSRGRKPATYMKKKTFLLRRSNTDYFPIRAEIDCLTQCGLGYARGPAKYCLQWSLAEMENYICSLYPDIPLDLVGFKMAKLEKSKKIVVLRNIEDGEDLKRLLAASQLIIIPNRDLPLSTELRTVHNNPDVGVHDIASIAPPPEVQQSRRFNNITDVGVREVANTSVFSDTELELSQYDTELEISVGYGSEIIFPNVAYDEYFEIEIDRSKIMDQLLEIYSSAGDTIIGQTLKVRFLKEEGDDFGGLTKELFSLFWQGCKERFFRGEQRVVPYLRLHRRMKDMIHFPVLGKILMHEIALTKAIPNLIARSTYLLLADITCTVPKEVIKEDFLMFITAGERELLQKAEKSFSTLKPFEETLLNEFFNAYDYLDLPKESEISDQILSIAENCLITQSINFIKAIKQGIPLMFEEFWNSINVENMTSLMLMQAATPNKVIECIQTIDDDLSRGQSSALYYLKVFIKALNREQLSHFLCFVTGSTNMPPFIKVSFTTLSGSCRRPIVHTCSNVVELPSTYADYQDFAQEFKKILESEHAFQYTQV